MLETALVTRPETVPIPAPPVEPPPDVNLFHPFALDPSRRGAATGTQEGTGHESAFGRLPGEAAGEGATTEAQRVAARIGGASIDANARARVEGGLVDPSYTALGRAFLSAWDPDRALPETTAEMWAKRRAQNAVVGMKLWGETARNYAMTGSPLAEGEEIEESVATNVRDAQSPAGGLENQQRRDTYRQYMKGKFNKGRSALVLVEQFPCRVKVSLVQSSGDLEVDRAALDDIRQAAQQVQRDAPALTGVRRSLWSLRLQIIINPPLPIGGFTFDEVLESPKLELPLGRTLLKRIQLEAIYDDDPRFAPENGSGG